MDMATIGRTGFATRALRRRRRRALGKRRRLAIPRTTSGLKILAQPLILATEPVTFAFQLLDAIAEMVVLSAEGLWRCGRSRRCARVVGRHADLMSHLDAPYKSHRLLTNAQTR
jgi:hypothetical protein